MQPCLREYGIEQEVKALVARCCGADRAPDELRDRLRAKIAALVVERRPRAGCRTMTPRGRVDRRALAREVVTAPARWPVRVRSGVGALAVVGRVLARAFFLRDFFAMATL